MIDRCAFPGCKAVLQPENASGVCRTHLHEKPYCGCKVCTGAPLRRVRSVYRVEAPPPKVYREPGMPRLPWEAAP